MNVGLQPDLKKYGFPDFIAINCETFLVRDASATTGWRKATNTDDGNEARAYWMKTVILVELEMPFVGSVVSKPNVFHLLKEIVLVGEDDVMDRDAVYYRHLLVFGV